jgi:hypothetical protein
MATLIAVLMKGLQASRANIKRDTYQAELTKRALIIGAKAEAHLFKYGTVKGFKPDSNDVKDPVGGTYSVVPATPATAGSPYTVKVSPEKGGILSGLGVESYTYSFY